MERRKEGRKESMEEEKGDRKIENKVYPHHFVVVLSSLELHGRHVAEIDLGSYQLLIQVENMSKTRPCDNFQEVEVLPERP
jgi:hypothetical protein